MNFDIQSHPDRTLRIALVGPAEPRAFEDLIDADVRDTLPPGLGGVPVNDLGRALHDAGHTLVLITSSRDIAEPMTFAGDRLTIEVHPYRSRARDRALDLFRAERRGVQKALKRHEVDVVHAHWTYEYAWGALSANAPVVVTAHDSPFTILRWQTDMYRCLRLAMAWRVRASTRYLTAGSPYLAERWKSTMRYQRDIAVVPNIAPFEAQPPRKRVPGSLNIVDVADASHLKNIRGLLRAFALVREAAPEARLTLIGGGLDTRGEIALWARDRKFDGGVSFLGAKSHAHVATVLQSSDVLAHASRQEAQPMILLEAMAYNLSIVAGRDSGGVAWTLGDGAVGELVDVASPRKFAEAILATRSRYQETNHSNHAAHKLLAERFSASAVRDGYLAVYWRAIADSQGKGQ